MNWFRKKSFKGQGSQAEGDSVRVDYGDYEWRLYEKAGYCFCFFFLSALVSYLFYHSMLPAVFLLPFITRFLKEQRQRLARKRREQLLREFMTGIRVVSNALAAGYSVENAFGEATGETRKVYGEGSMIVTEFSYLEAMLKVNRTLEYLLEDLGKRSHVEDIEDFAEVFSVARRSGGDLNQIIRSTIENISEKEETRQEIETGLALKRMEQKVMSVIPLFILFYVGAASPEFLEDLYGNISGIMIMSICLLVYLLAFQWGRKMVRIEV